MANVWCRYRRRNGGSWCPNSRWQYNDRFLPQDTSGGKRVAMQCVCGTYRGDAHNTCKYCGVEWDHQFDCSRRGAQGGYEPQKVEDVDSSQGFIGDQIEGKERTTTTLQNLQAAGEQKHEAYMADNEEYDISQGWTVKTQKKRSQKSVRIGSGDAAEKRVGRRNNGLRGSICEHRERQCSASEGSQQECGHIGRSGCERQSRQRVNMLSSREIVKGCERAQCEQESEKP